jgi:hypothetical protein
MNQRYFYIKDKIDSGDVKVVHCPTEEMVADFMSKPLQGKLFFYFRDSIMNIDPSSKYHSSNQRSVLRLSNSTDQDTDRDRQTNDPMDDVARRKTLEDKKMTYADVVKKGLSIQRPER